MNWPRATCRLTWLTVFSILTAEGVGSEYPSKAISPRPELVVQLTKELSIRPTRTAAGADTLFNLDESCLSHSDIVNTTAVAPRTSRFLEAAPDSDNRKSSSSLNSSIPAAYGKKWPTSLCQYGRFTRW